MRRFFVCLFAVLLLATVSACGEIVFTDTPDPTPSPAPVPTVAPPPVEIIITAAGDVTLGGNMKDNPSSTIYTRAVDAHDGDLSFLFENVRELFAADDMTLVNFEGTLTDNTKREKNNSFHFRAPPSHLEALTLANIEAVAFENNHTMDFGQQGWDDTVRAFDENGIVYSSIDHPGVYRVKGVSIAMLSYQTFDGAYPMLMERVPQDIAAARAEHDIVIVSFHWGIEGDFHPNDNQIMLGRATIDAGADLVLGHHSHRVNPIERYNGKYIVYSLANCSFSGNIQPDNMDTFLFQQKFIVENGNATSGDFRIIPASISSNTGKSGKASDINDFIVTPFPEGSPGITRLMKRLADEGRALQYAVPEYPTEWR